MRILKIKTPRLENFRYVQGELVDGHVFQKLTVGLGKSWEEGGIGPGGDGDVWTVHERYEERLIPVFNTSFLSAGELKELKALTREQVSERPPSYWIEKYGHALFTMGGNRDGSLVVDVDEEKKKKREERLGRVASKKEAINFTGSYFGYHCTTRVPKDLWDKHMKPWAKYWDRHEARELLEDMGGSFTDPAHVAGWNYQRGAIESILKTGYPVTWKGRPVTSFGDIKKIEKQMEKEAGEAREKRKEIEKRKQELQKGLDRLFSDRSITSLPESGEIEGIKKLGTVLLPVLGHKGQDIYGGGSWFHEGENAIYYVRNNGMDGGDWSCNNYPTGGAGAICWKIEGPKGKEWLDRARAFEKSMTGQQ